MEYDIKDVIAKVKEELSVVNETAGLCYYASNNVVFDLEYKGIESFLFNVREICDIDFDHYFVLANKDENNKYLIDLAYSQFLEKKEKPRFFEKWPSAILNESEEGKRILDNLKNNGYLLVDDNDFYTYLKSFNPNLEIFFTLDDLLPLKTR